MAYTKRISIRSTVKNAINYITNVEKTSSAAPIENQLALSYISDKDKTLYGELVYGYLCNPDTAAEEFELIRNQNIANVGKNVQDSREILAHHFIISFRKEDEINPKEALAFGVELMEKDFKYHQAVIAVHTNTGNTHIHIVMNSHTTDPIKQYGKLTRMKYNSDKKSYQKLRNTSDMMCIERGLSIEKPVYKFDKNHLEAHISGHSRSLFAEVIRSKINKSIEKSKSWEDYKDNLKVLGVEVNERGNTISYRANHLQMLRPIRENRLGENYSKENVERRIDYNLANLSFNKFQKSRKHPEYSLKSVTMSGKPKSSAEIILNIASVILSREQSLSISSEREKQARIQALYDTQKLRKKYGLETIEDINNKIKTLRNKLQNYSVKKQNIVCELTNKQNTAYEIYKSVENKKHKILIKNTPEENINSFKTRPKTSDISTIEGEIKRLEREKSITESAIKEVSKQYRDIVSLKRMIQKAREIKQHHSDIKHKDETRTMEVKSYGEEDNKNKDK